MRGENLHRLYPRASGTGEDNQKGRGAGLLGALELLTFITSRRLEFDTGDVCRELRVGYRTALRWMGAAEAAGVVEIVTEGGPNQRCVWVSRIRLVIGE